MKNFKTILSLILALSMVFSVFTAFAEDTDDETEETEIVTEFSDIDKTTIVGKAVTELAMRGIVHGYPDGTYMPEGYVTRAEFAVICVTLAGLADGLGTDAVTGFSDLDGDDSYKWVRPYVHMATGQGVITGFEDGTFRAGEPVTYEQAVKMLMCLKGYGDVCEAETARQQEFNYNLSWSVGYLTYANQQGLLKNTNNNELVYTQPVNRGDVAILAYNSLSIDQLVKTVGNNGVTTYVPSGSSGSSSGSGSGSSGDTTVQTVSGVVTATYVTSLDSDTNDLGRYEIMIGKNIYEVDSKILNKFDLNEIIGQRIKATYNKRDELITAISTNYYETTQIYSGVSGNSRNFLVEIDEETGKILYSSNSETYKTSSVSIAGYNVLFNGKYVEDFKPADLADPESPYYFTNGMIEIINGGNYKTVKISNYKTYVISKITTGSSTSATSATKLTILYKSGSERVIDLPESEGGEYFAFRRNGTEITAARDLAVWDVLNVMESPESASGIGVKIIEVSRNSKTSQKVYGVGQNDPERVVDIGGTLYQYNYDYINYDPETGVDTKYELKSGDEGVSVYFDYMGQIAAVAMSTTSSTTSYKYGYLLGVEQNKSASSTNEKLQLYLLDENGSTTIFGTNSRIYIDGKSYTNTDTSIPALLEESAAVANAAYLDSDESKDENGESVVLHQVYQQPVRYRLSSSGSSIITYLDTVAESNIDEYDLEIDSAYSGKRTVSSSAGNFGDFIVSDSYTKVIFVPDDRTSYNNYEVMSSPTSNFTALRSYHVEAYNLDSSKRARLVLVYKTNDSLSYNYKTPFMIVTNKNYDFTKEVNTITGFYCKTSTVSTTTTGSNCTYEISDKLSSEGRALYESIGKGDIVRFLLDSEGAICDLQIWLDVDDPIQNDSVGTIEEAVDNRIMAYSQTTDGDPDNGDIPTAPFRLAYGMVYNHIADDKTLTVTAALPGDDFEISDTDTGAIAHHYSTTTKVFLYNGSREGVEYVGTAGFDMLSSYLSVGDEASIVVTYTTGTTTTISNSQVRFIYIIKL